jgi:hypothetical protein
LPFHSADGDIVSRLGWSFLAAASAWGGLISQGDRRMKGFDRKRSAIWHQRFVALLPTILRYVVPAFRKLNQDAKAEAVQEAVANACLAYARLVERGKESLAFATVLAKFAIAQVRVGRRVGGQLNIRDVSSGYAQHRKKFRVERLDRFDPAEGCWREAIIEDRRTPILDQVAFRIDFSAWLKTLPRRDRKIAKALAEGHRTTDVAQHWGLSMSRISQLRREFFTSWQRFLGEAEEKDRMDLLAAA